VTEEELLAMPPLEFMRWVRAHLDAFYAQAPRQRLYDIWRPGTTAQYGHRILVYSEVVNEMNTSHDEEFERLLEQKLIAYVVRRLE
jgi:hypothetical protein